MMATHPRIAIPLLLSAAVLACAAIARAQAPPSIDGDMTDLLQYAMDLNSQGTGFGVIIDDPAGEVLAINTEVVPCVPMVDFYFANGFDQVKFVLAQPSGGSTLYLGLRTAGVIGDTDGNGNPDGAGGAQCYPDVNIPDESGIGPGEHYVFQFDLESGPAFRPGSMLRVSDNKVIGTGIFASVTGSVADGSIAFRGPGGHDLELQVLSAPLPAHFRVRALVAAAGTGETEDFGVIREVGSATGVAPLAWAGLDRATPNPFVTYTSLAYEVSQGGGAGVEIAVYDVAGREVRRLVSGFQAAGRHVVTWDGRADSGALGARGLYFVRATIGGQTAPTQRVLFLQ